MEDNKKKFSINERIRYYEEQLADAQLAIMVTIRALEDRMNYFKKRLESLRAEKTGTKES